MAVTVVYLQLRICNVVNVLVLSLFFVRSNIGFHTCKSSRGNATTKIGQTLPLERLLLDIVFKVLGGTL